MENLPDSQRVVVTGLGVVHSLGHTADAFWASLVAGKNGISRVTLFAPSPFATQIGAVFWEEGIVPTLFLAAIMSPSARMAKPQGTGLRQQRGRHGAPGGVRVDPLRHLRCRSAGTAGARRPP